MRKPTKKPKLSKADMGIASKVTVPELDVYHNGSLRGIEKTYFFDFSPAGAAPNFLHHAVNADGSYNTSHPSRWWNDNDITHNTIALLTASHRINTHKISSKAPKSRGTNAHPAVSCVYISPTDTSWLKRACDDSLDKAIEQCREHFLGRWQKLGESTAGGVQVVAGSVLSRSHWISWVLTLTDTRATFVFVNSYESMSITEDLSNFSQCILETFCHGDGATRETRTLKTTFSRLRDPVYTPYKFSMREGSCVQK